MRRNVIWAVAVVALVAIPAVIGLIVVRGDDSSSEARRSAALVDATNPGVDATLTLAGTVIPAGKAIEVESFSWGMSHSGGVAGRANIQDISFTKTMDESSPNLMQACASGQHIASAKLTMMKVVSGQPPKAYAIYDLTDVVISKVEQGKGRGDVPTESVTLNFAQVKLEYTAPDKTGVAGAKSMFSWNLKTNAKA